MHRFTISIDDELAREFDAFIAAIGYENRSEAVRDIVREKLEQRRLGRTEGKYCVATVSFVYNHHERTLFERIAQIQHDHHDLTVSTMHVHLDHHDCLETVVLRGPTARVRQCADRLIAERGVRHGSIKVVPMKVDSGRHRHAGGAGDSAHVHASPVT